MPSVLTGHVNQLTDLTISVSMRKEHGLEVINMLSDLSPANVCSFFRVETDLIEIHTKNRHKSMNFLRGGGGLNTSEKKK